MACRLFRLPGLTLRFLGSLLVYEIGIWAQQGREEYQSVPELVAALSFTNNYLTKVGS